MEFESKSNSRNVHPIRRNQGAVVLWIVILLLVAGLLVALGVVNFSGDPVTTVTTEPAEAMAMDSDLETSPTVASPQIPPPAPAPASAVNTNTLPEG